MLAFRTMEFGGGEEIESNCALASCYTEMGSLIGACGHDRPAGRFFSSVSARFVSWASKSAPAGGHGAVRINICLLCGMVGWWVAVSARRSVAAYNCIRRDRHLSFPRIRLRLVGGGERRIHREVQPCRSVGRSVGPFCFFRPHHFRFA